MADSQLARRLKLLRDELNDKTIDAEFEAWWQNQGNARYKPQYKDWLLLLSYGCAMATRIKDVGAIPTWKR